LDLKPMEAFSKPLRKRILRVLSPVDAIAIKSET
jgi:hypothetical protein